MKFQPTRLDTVILIESEVLTDARGAFWEVYRQDTFKASGITETFVQENHSRSAKGVLRGLHYQCAPKAQSKLVHVTQGSAFDVAVDLRSGSPTFGQWVSEILSSEKKNMLYIPVGFAHGFLALEDHTELVYKVGGLYSPEHERGIIWNDPELAIQWPNLGVHYILSDKDRELPSFASLLQGQSHDG